jgi:hypothetical protein
MKNICASMYHWIIDFLTNRLLIAHYGQMKDQIINAFVVGIAFSPFAYLLEHITDWSIANQGYMYWVFIAVSLDHLLGSWNHYFHYKDFNFRKNAKGLIEKGAIVLMGGLIFEGIGYFLESDTLLRDYLSLVLRLSIFMYPANSAIDNLFIFSGGKFPPSAFMNWKKNFNKDFSLPNKEGFKDKEEIR